MATLTDLANRMKALPAILASEGSRCAVEVAMAMETNLVRTTPVDTSNALSNWQGSLENPIFNEIMPYSVGTKGSTRIVSGNEAIAETKRAIENKQPGQSVFLSNNAPYIRDLDSGSISKQPGGFVSASLLIGHLTARRFKMKLR